MLQEHDGKDWKTKEELLPSGHQAPKHKLCLIKKKKKEKPVCTSLSSLLFIVLFIKSHILFLHILLVCTSYCFALFFILLHILLFISFFTYIYALVWCYFYIFFYSLHCPLSGPDLTYISLLIIPYIIYYVTNKETLTLIMPNICVWHEKALNLV